MKILIVDDLEDARVMMHKLLKSMGHDVESAVNGLEGLDAARQFLPDLIFTDVMMPEMDGFQLCRAVNDDASLKHIPVIIHSATFDDPEDEKVATESGATSFIKKPISEKEFVEIVNQVISRFESGELNHSRQRSVSSEELDIMHYRSLVNKLYSKTESLEQEIVSRKNAYELLEINEDRYRSLLNNAPNVAICMTGEHFITEFNKEAERIYGYTRAEVVGKDYLELFVPKEYHENVAADIQKVLAGEPTFGYKNPAMSKDGTQHDLLWNITHMLNIEGAPVGIIAMGVDITERKKAEEALHDEMQSRKIILDNIPCIAMLLRPDTHEVVTCNKKGTSLGLAPGKKCFEIWPDSTSPCSWCLCEKTERTGMPHHVETSAYGKNYELYWVPLKKDLTLHYIFDITERRNAEKALIESEELHRITISNISDAVFITDYSGQFTYIGTNVDIIFGYSLKEVETIGNISGLIGENLYSHEELTSTGELTNIEREISDSNGNIHFLLINVKKVSIKGGTVLYTCRDITDRRILEKAVIDFEEQERQRIGHDLHDDVGQLLTGLGFKTQGLLEKLKDINGGLYEEGEEISELVEQAKNKLRHLTKGLLPVDLSDMGLVEAIEGLVSDINRLFDIKCNFNYIEDFSINNEGAVIHLYRIVQEAVTNALKHAKADKVEIKLDRSNNDVTMIIKDNGVGISESELSTGGIGLKIMEYRTRLINASLKVYKDADSGTVVKCIMTDR